MTGNSTADGLLHIALHTRAPLSIQSGCTIAVTYSTGARVPTASLPCGTGTYRELAYARPAAAASMTFTFTTPAFRIGTVSFPATRTTRTFKGPALSTVISRIGLKRSYRYARIRAGLPVTLTLRRPGRLQVGVVGSGNRLFGASRVRRVRAGKVSVRVPLSPVLATRRRTRATVEIRFAPDKQPQLKVRRRITITC